jgi:hypothetical protein
VLVRLPASAHIGHIVNNPGDYLVVGHLSHVPFARRPIAGHRAARRGALVHTK